MCFCRWIAAESQLTAEVSRDRLKLDRENAKRQAERDAKAFDNPMHDEEDEEVPSVSFCAEDTVFTR
eukprot:COSAG02_NODE_3959_length_5983_cov_9.304176_8_plen_67_part_00